MTAIPSDPIWVSDSETLNELCARWSQQAAIAVDTEFMRSSTFFPKTALFQVGDGTGCYLIDPLSVDDFRAFAKLMVNPDVVKVFHSCSEDMEVFQTFMQVTPAPLFDTQVAAAVAGRGFSLGYAKLIQLMLDVEIPKSETRSDWLQRPLSHSQLQYAAVDVAYLLVAYGLLLKELKQQDRLAWVQSDCNDIVSQAQQGVDPEQLYLKVKSAWKLNRKQLLILQRLVSWREQQARERDVPRNRLIKERALWDMARLQPTGIRQISELEGMTPRTVKQDGDQLLEIIQTASLVDEALCPARLPRPLPPEEGDLIKALKQKSREIAEAINVAPEALVRKKDFEDLVRSRMENASYSLNTRLSGWRRDVVGEELLRFAQNWSA